LIAGAIGATIGNPMDLCLVRMQADATLPLEKRRNYKHVFDAMIRIVREEGLLSLWIGTSPTVARAMAMNFAMLVSYDESKERIEKLLSKDKTTTVWILSSCISGACAATFSLPFDNVKTKL
jgi:solute carrier family 25 oxoglutarate transporter 11